MDSRIEWIENLDDQQRGAVEKLFHEINIAAQQNETGMRATADIVASQAVRAVFSDVQTEGAEVVVSYPPFSDGNQTILDDALGLLCRDVSQAMAAGSLDGMMLGPQINPSTYIDWGRAAARIAVLTPANTVEVRNG